MGEVKYCTICRKLSYPSKSFAYRVIMSVIRRRGGSYRAYACPKKNGNWHITSKVTRSKGRREDV